MKVIYALMCAAAAAGSVTDPTIRLKKPETNTTVNIIWDGITLSIPQHTDRIANNTARIAALETLVGTMSTKLDNLYDFVHQPAVSVNWPTGTVQRTPPRAREGALRPSGPRSWWSTS